MNKIKEEVANGNRPFESSKATFDIPEFAENNYNDKQASKQDHFSSISNEFKPIDVNEFPPNIKDKLDKGKWEKNVPILE